MWVQNLTWINTQITTFWVLFFTQKLGLSIFLLISHYSALRAKNNGKENYPENFGSSINDWRRRDATKLTYKIRWDRQGLHKRLWRCARPSCRDRPFKIALFPFGFLTPASISVITSEDGHAAQWSISEARCLKSKVPKKTSSCVSFPSLTHPFLGHSLLSEDLSSPSPEVSALPKALNILNVLNYQEVPFAFIFYSLFCVFVLSSVPPAGQFHSEPH